MVALPLPSPEIEASLPAETVRHLKRGQAAIEAGDTSKAEHEIAALANKSLRDPAARAHILWAIGAALHSAGKYEEALSFIQDAIKLKPHDIQLRVALGVVLADLKRAREALEAFDFVLSIQDNPTVAQARREVLDAQLMDLVTKGFGSWSGQRVRGSRAPVPITAGPPVSDYVVEDRR